MTGHTLTVTREYMDAGWSEGWERHASTCDAATARRSRIHRLREAHKPHTTRDGVVSWEEIGPLGREHWTLTWTDSEEPT